MSISKFIDPVHPSTILESEGDGRAIRTIIPGSLHEATGEDVRMVQRSVPDIPTVHGGIPGRAASNSSIATLIVRPIDRRATHKRTRPSTCPVLLYYLELGR